MIRKDRLRTLASELCTWVRRLWLVVAAVGISLLLQEFYPFSHNPMYSRNGPKTYYLHLTDEEGQPIIFREQFGRSAVRLKKIYDKRLVKLKKLRKKEDPEFKSLDDAQLNGIAARETLIQIVDERRPRVPDPDQYAGLQLWRTDLRLEGGNKIKDSVQLVGERTLP